jgi:hypothetical protein
LGQKQFPQGIKMEKNIASSYQNMHTKTNKEIVGINIIAAAAQFAKKHLKE